MQGFMECMFVMFGFFVCVVSECKQVCMHAGCDVVCFITMMISENDIGSEGVKALASS